jgi:hypothetical protein
MFLNYKFIKSKNARYVPKQNRIKGTRWVVLKCDNCKKTKTVRFTKTVNYKNYQKLTLEQKKIYQPAARYCSNNCRKEYFVKLGCKVKGCKKQHHSNGYCVNHNEMQRRYGDPLGNVCLYCKSFFNTNRTHHAHRLEILPRCCYKCYRVELRKLVLKKYNNKCKCCGEKEKRFLQLDHVMGGGRKDYNIRSQELVFEEALSNNKKFQLLCANCNIGRYLNGGVCPHKDNT